MRARVSHEPGSGVDWSVNFATVLYGGIVLAFGAWIVSAPLPVLLDRFIPDDAFYYFKTAQVFATSGFSSFDELHFTNGYQPLWFLLSVPVFLWFPEGGELPFRLLLILQVTLAAGAGLLMARVVATAFGPIGALVTGLVWIVVFHRPMINGLETSLQCFLFALLLRQFLRYLRAETEQQRARRALGLGGVGALFFLARTDGVFLLGFVGLWFLLRARRERASGDLLRFAVPVAIVASAYVGLNLIATGHLMPVSGAAKMYHSGVARQAAFGGRPNLAGQLGNVLWPVRDGAWWIVASLLAPLALLAVEVVAPPRSAPRLRIQTWPFAAGVWASFLFYAIAFFGGFSRTHWYYGPLTMLGWLCLAGLAAALSRLPLLGRVPWCVPFLFVGGVLGWLSVPAAAAVAVGISVAVSIARRVRHNLQAGLAVAAFGAAVILLGYTFLVNGISLASWTIVSVTSAILGGLIAVERFRKLALMHVVVGIVAPTLIVYSLNLAVALTSPPGYWGYHLYQGALWAKKTLPKTATIWSGSAGILGYFSERRVINTDGLANDYYFLDDVLKTGKLGNYVRQFDYAIDAMANDSLKQHVPEGCFVPLPSDLQLPPFTDGALERRLRVFQMKSTGVVDCRAQAARAARRQTAGTTAAASLPSAERRP